MQKGGLPVNIHESAEDYLEAILRLQILQSSFASQLLLLLTWVSQLARMLSHVTSLPTSILWL